MATVSQIQHPGPGAKAAPVPPKSAPHILLVDDDPLIVNSLSEFLRLEGHHVDTAPDGALAAVMKPQRSPISARRYQPVRKMSRGT